jgi:hypothetical protein
MVGGTGRRASAPSIGVTGSMNIQKKLPQK